MQIKKTHMQNKIDTVQQVKKFAEATLGNHIAKLNTRYENQKIDKQTMQQAWSEHQKICEKELNYKIQYLLSSEKDSQQKVELENVKDIYLPRLNVINQ